MANENAFSHKIDSYTTNMNEEQGKFTDLHSCTEQNDLDTDFSRSDSPYGNELPYQLKTFDDLCNYIRHDGYAFIFKPVPKNLIDCTKCRLKCESSGLFQTYQLEIELDRNIKPISLLTADKQLKLVGRSQYLITLDSQFDSLNNLSAELTCDNLSGTSYTLVDLNRNPKQKLAIISYEANFLGLNGPRKMQILLPKFDDQGRLLFNENEIEEYCSEESNDSFVQLNNREPGWIQESGIHVLQFEGQNRITEPSIKNFQLISERKDIKQNLMQFGRMSENIYSCDFRYPFSFIQAFCIGLSALETSLFRE